MNITIKSIKYHLFLQFVIRILIILTIKLKRKRRSFVKHTTSILPMFVYYSITDSEYISNNCEVAICHVARHANTNIIDLHWWVCHSTGILNRIHVAVAYNVTNRKLTIIFLLLIYVVYVMLLFIFYTQHHRYK